MRLGFLSTIAFCASAVSAVPAASSQHWRRLDTVEHWDRVVNHEALPSHQLRSKDNVEVCQTNVKQLSGYLDTASDKHFFYWFFESQNKTAGPNTPLVVWLNGGPGCSSMVGLLTELGPCLISDDGKSTVPNPHSWNQNAHVLFIDQPTNTGFSYGTQTTNSTAAATDFVALLQLFYKTYTEYASSPLVLAGESYAGHYLPHITSAILDHNAANSAAAIPLQSVAIGNPLINVGTQFQSLAQMSCNSTYAPILDEDICQQLEFDAVYCAKLIDKCLATENENRCGAALAFCTSGVQSMYVNADKLNNPYDVRTKCDYPPSCYLSNALAEQFLNQTSVQQALSAHETNYQGCSTSVQQAFFADFDMIRPADPQISRILNAGIEMLIYVGDADWLCNHYGVKQTMLNIDWHAKSKFTAAADKPWMVNGKQAGEIRAAKNLKYLRIFESGHMVPMDQPENALEMINTWISGSSFTA
ncbi:hypothetical protein IWW55_000713 [Coemansia sp. RSA 2706]|nr:hypothetical protein IWW55_000713 [Coemansia sp. RSA 2706]KAJ2314804.1 hypothetical protein IWW54_000700 [Coemansia sp. RSA 2705]KAJ2329093.1 hypothetical protein IWW51_000813 [Coemansia sp. RSA 2702]KAJ2392962.1 hypothetical protein H4S02_000496 [Coemansia sp. RSA 2611]KAJ2739371.1 hypothetical protein H4R23_000521 [Coemansia sp. Cherry 401B]